MRGNLNIQRNLFLEKEELVKFQEFILDNNALHLWIANTSNYGIIRMYGVSSNDFLIEQGTNPSTIKMSNNGYILDVNNQIGYLPAFDNLTVPVASTYYWLKVSFRSYKPEVGTIGSIDTATGVVTGVNTEFLSVLRGQASGVPSKIKFYIEDEYGVEDTVNNTGVYEVVEVISDTSLVLSGDLVAEVANAKYIDVGSYTLGTQLTDDQKSGVFNYDYALLEWVEGVDAITPPETLTANEEFWIAVVIDNAGTVTVTDKRTEFWTINLGDTFSIDLSTYMTKTTNVDLLEITDTDLTAYIDNDFNITNSQGIVDVVCASTPCVININLPTASSTNKNHIITVHMNISYGTLDIYDDVTSLISLGAPAEGYVTVKSDGSNWYIIASSYTALPGRQGLSELATNAENEAATGGNKVVTSAGLENMVGSKLKRAIIEIGDWNMNSTGSVTVSHGLTLSTIRGIEVMIRNDADNTYYPLTSRSLGGSIVNGYVVQITSALVALERVSGGVFDSVDFDSTSYNRGWIIIYYTNS